MKSNKQQMTSTEAGRYLERLGYYPVTPMKKGNKIYAFWGKVPFDQVGIADYQRGLTEAWSADIAKDFVLDCANPLRISFRMEDDCNFWCYDGQHTMEGMKLLGFKEHYAIFIFDKTYEEEAQRFFILNDAIRRMNGWVKFKAAYNAGNSECKRLIAACKKRGLTTPVTTNLRPGKCDIKAPGYLLSPYKYGMPVVNGVLDVFNQCWRVTDGSVSEEAKDTALVRGLAMFLKQHYLGHSRLPWSTIKLVLANISPDVIREEAKKKPAKRVDQKQYHEAICGLFNVDHQIPSPTGLKRAA